MPTSLSLIVFTTITLLLLFVIIIMIARQAIYIKGHPIFTRDVLFLFSKVHQFLNIENTTTTIHSKQPPTVNVYCNVTDSIHQYNLQSTVSSNILVTRVKQMSTAMLITVFIILPLK